MTACYWLIFGLPQAFRIAFRRQSHSAMICLWREQGQLLWAPRANWHTQLRRFPTSPIRIWAPLPRSQCSIRLNILSIHPFLLCSTMFKNDLLSERSLSRQCFMLKHIVICLPRDITVMCLFSLINQIHLLSMSYKLFHLFVAGFQKDCRLDFRYLWWSLVAPRWLNPYLKYIDKTLKDKIC